jgi:hypothetical protein
VSDDFFETVHSEAGEEPEEWGDLITFNKYRSDLDDAVADELKLADEWLSPEERHDRRQQELERKELDQKFDMPLKTNAPPETAQQPDIRSELPVPYKPKIESDSEMMTDVPDSNFGQSNDLKVQSPILTNPPTKSKSSKREADLPTQPVRRSTRSTKGKLPSRYDDYVVDLTGARACIKNIFRGLMGRARPQVLDMRYALALLTDIDYATLEDVPTNLSMIPAMFKTTQADPDLPTFREAMNGPQRDEFVKAMDEEMAQLTKMNAWTIMNRSSVPEGVNILPLTWVLRVKRYPDGRFRKHKARLCVRGDKQIEGIDYFEKYAPVVQWSTVRMMICLAATQGLKTRQIDFTNAFVQATLKEDVYVKCPEGYGPENGEDVVLKLNKSLYGLVQAPMHWVNHLRDGLTKRGFTPSPHDPCMFSNKDGVIILAYVDDCLMFAPSNNLIDKVIDDLKHEFPLTVESDKNEDVYAYLGVDLKRNSDGTITFTQKGLVDKILRTVGLQDCSPRATPCNTEPLGSDAKGARHSESWSYPSVIGMLLYLSSNSRPDIQFAVHQCARFTHNPKASHSEALKRVCRYLKGTQDQGMTFKPSQDIQLNCYVDADFARLWHIEDDQDPVCVKSRTGYVLTLGNCPLIWVSKLQSEVALSTTEAEYIALSQAMRDLLPMRALLQEVATVMNLTSSKPVKVLSKVFEDNNGALTLAIAPKINPRTKHIAVKYHHFREHIGVEKGIEIVKIDTKDQLADAFTKGLPKDQFENLRKRLIGW